ncbi:hypothetical protein [Agrococcus jejuensis]|uniref:hypothetical protein n=1 Tax=Agrococcus jejuensis TaxID=399736 RepID=UPI0011A6599D|nr:hypothetical protein [Agrococcus jejuensis]
MTANEAGRRRRGIAARVATIVAVLGLLYGCHVVRLEIGRTEGDVPPASALALPPGTVVVATDSMCASGGCWRWLEVTPAEGTTPPALMEALGTTPDRRLPGSIVDPRSIVVHAVVDDDRVGITMSY